MKYKDMPSVKAKEYVRKVLPFEGTMDRAIVANRLQRAYIAGYDAARRRFSRRGHSATGDGNG